MSEYINKLVKVTEIEEQEDGSATLQVECDPETFAGIFKAGVIDMIKAVLEEEASKSVDRE